MKHPLSVRALVVSAPWHSDRSRNGPTSTLRGARGSPISREAICASIPRSRFRSSSGGGYCSGRRALRRSGVARDPPASVSFTGQTIWLSSLWKAFHNEEAPDDPDLRSSGQDGEAAERPTEVLDLADGEVRERRETGTRQRLRELHE